MCELGSSVSVLLSEHCVCLRLNSVQFEFSLLYPIPAFQGTIEFLRKFHPLHDVITTIRGIY